MILVFIPTLELDCFLLAVKLLGTRETAYLKLCTLIEFWRLVPILTFVTKVPVALREIIETMSLPHQYHLLVEVS